MADVARTPPVGVAGIARAPSASAAGVAEARGRVNSVSVAARGVEADRHTSSWSNCTVPQAIEDIRFALQSTGEERDALEMVMTMMAVSCCCQISWGCWSCSSSAIRIRGKLIVRRGRQLCYLGQCSNDASKHF